MLTRSTLESSVEPVKSHSGQNFQPFGETEETTHQVLDLLVGNSSVGIAIACGSDQKILHTNDAYRRILGYEAGELEGLTFAELSHPDDIESEQYQIEQLLGSNLSKFKTEKRMQTKQGNWAWLKTTVTLMRDSSQDVNSPLKTLVMVEDISQEKQIIEALAQKEACYRAIVEAMPETTIVQYDRNGLRSTYGSPKREILDQESILGKSIHETLLEETILRQQQTINESEESSENKTHEYRLITSESHQHYFDVQVINSSPTETLAVIRDTTSHKETSEQLIAQDQKIQALVQQIDSYKEKLKQSERLATLGSVAAANAIEFRQLLAQIYKEFGRTFQNMQAVMTILSLYEQHYPMPVKPIEAERACINPDSCLLQLPKGWKLIRNRIDQADASAQIVQAFAETQLTSGLIDVHDYLNRVVQSLQPLLKRVGIKVKKEYRGKQSIYGYPHQIYQALIHLIREIIELYKSCKTIDAVLKISTSSSSSDYLQVKFETNAYLNPVADPDDGEILIPELSLARQVVETIHKGKITQPNLLEPNPCFIIELPTRLQVEA